MRDVTYHRRAEYVFLVVLVWMAAAVGIVAVRHQTSRLPQHIVIDDRIDTNAATPNGGTVVCEGDGQTGQRVQPLYVHAANHADRYNQQLGTLRNVTVAADAWYSQGAADTGQTRHVRYVTNPIQGGCDPNIPDVSVPSTATFGDTIDGINQQGYNRQDRDYLMFVDDTVYCGVGSLEPDDRPGADNPNNTGPGYARVDSSCWSGSAAAHELAHNFGAVQLSAPHSSGGYHCYDGADVMCYNDNGSYYRNGGKLLAVCSTVTFDCGHDDYYNAGQPSGYLASHWNVANSSFLIGGGPSPTTTTSSSTSTTGSTSTTLSCNARILGKCYHLPRA